MPPTLLALKGHPGVGKSSLADALACALRSSAGLSSTVIAKDDVRDALDDACRCDGDDGGASHPPPSWLNAAANDAAVRAAGTALTCGGVDVVILDTTLSCEASFARLCGRAAAAGVGRVVVIEVCLESQAEVWDARLRGRQSTHKPADMEAVNALIASYGGRDGWAAERAGFCCGGDGHDHGPVSRTAALPLPWAAAGAADRTDAGVYVRVDTGAGLGPADLADGVVAALRDVLLG
jgi:predicted kinase